MLRSVPDGKPLGGSLRIMELYTIYCWHRSSKTSPSRMLGEERFKSKSVDDQPENGDVYMLYIGKQWHFKTVMK